MSERHFPIDAIGNRIREGGLCHISIPQSGTLVHVIKVEPGGMLAGLDGKAMEMEGKIHIALTIPFRPGRPVPSMLCLQQPNQERGPIAVPTDREAAEIIGERKQ
jgi:hypothetical protein